MIGPIVQWVNTLLFFYYLACNLIYLRLLVAAIKASVNQNRRQKTAWLDRVRRSPLTPPISGGCGPSRSFRSSQPHWPPHRPPNRRRLQPI